MTFVFHSDVADTEERVTHDSGLEPRKRLDEIAYEIVNSNSGSILCRRNEFPKLINLDVFLTNSRKYIGYGDLLEFAAEDKKSHWVLYLGQDENNIDSCIFEVGVRFIQGLIFQKSGWEAKSESQLFRHALSQTPENHRNQTPPLSGPGSSGAPSQRGLRNTFSA